MKNFLEPYLLYDLAVQFGVKVYEQNIAVHSTVYNASCTAIKAHGTAEENLYLDMIKEKNFEKCINSIFEKKVKDPYLIYIYFRNCMQKNIINQQQFRKFLLVNYGKIVSAALTYDIITNFINYFLIDGKPDLKSIHYYLRANNLHKYVSLKEANDKSIYSFMETYL